MSDTETESDNEFLQDIQALKKACSLTGFKPKTDDDVIPKSSSSTVTLDDDVSDDDLFDDMELLRDIKKRFSIPKSKGEEEDEVVVMKPLNTILPEFDDCDNIDDEDYGGDLETLRAIQRRFSQYNGCTSNGMESPVQRSEKQVGATNIKESSPNFFETRINNEQGFPDSVDGREADNHISSNLASATNVSEAHEPGSELVPQGDSGFPASAQAFVEAIKKNRTYQKFLRDKLIKVGARLEENKKLRERVKFLKGFQVDCRKRTGRALSHKKDPRFQLIAVPKLRANASKKKDMVKHPINQGPAQNRQVAIYKEAMLKYPVSFSREPWSKADNENLKKGIKQQIQEMMMQNLFSAEDPNSSNLDRMITRIKKREITPAEIRSFLPNVNWEQLASMYLTGRSGPECESRWRNCEDPLINRGQWTNVEEKKMLHCFSNRGFSNWIDIAKELKTNRTPYQCLARFQRSLNPSILKNEWTPTEDEELRKAVVEYGESNWQAVASVLSGWTGTQCSNRWKRSLNPLRERVGRWNSDEDKRLKIAVRLFGAKNWHKITKFVPGRTQVQCRERWVNCLDPSLKVDKWTEEEDMRLIAAVEEHNHRWARVAACITQRTDSQCRRRWMVLLPQQVLVLKAAKEIEKRCFVSNFVDREGERPQLTYKDFNKPLLLESAPKAKGKKRRNVGKDRPRRAKKVANTRKARKLVDEDDVENNDGQADVTSNGDGENFEVEKETTGSRKSQGKERSIKVWTRRSRQATRTTKVSKLIDEDVGEDNDGHGDITSNERVRQQSLKTKANTSLEDAGLLEHDNGEGIRTNDGDNCEIKKKPTRKRKQRTVGKDRPERAKKVARTGKARKLVDEDDLENNDGQADVASNGDGENCEVEKEATAKRESQGKDRRVRARKVARNGKARKLVDEDDVENNDGQADVASNGDGENCEVEKEATGKRESQGKDRRGRAKKVARTGKARKLVDEDDVENNDGQADVASNGNGENCEVGKEATGKRESLGKDRPGRAKTAARTGEARKLVDEDEVENNDGQADVARNGNGENSEVEKEATGKRECQGKERGIIVWTRRARKDTLTTKVLKPIDEDVGEDNHGHGDITNNGRVTRQSLKTKANTSLNGEETSTFDGDNCEIKKKPTRKQRVDDEHEEMDANCEPGPTLNEILTSERNKRDSFSVRRSPRVPVMIEDVPSRNESCSSQVILKSMSGDGPQAKTLKKCKVSCKLPNETNGNHSRGGKRKIDIENRIRKREAVAADGSVGFGEMLLEDEETFANFKKRTIGEIVLEDEETFANFKKRWA